MAEEDPFYVSSSIFDADKGKNGKSRASLIEKKIEFLENLAGKVSNRRSRRWLNDRLLIELVPRLNVQEIRGLFAPPPWGDDVPLSPFCLTNVGEWNSFRNADMDEEMSMIISLKSTSVKRKAFSDPDTIAALNAWHRVDWRSRKALRHNYLSNLIEIYEEQLRAFIKHGGEGDVLMIHVQDPYHRLLLHGVCEFYNLLSTTITKSTDEGKSMKVMSIKRKSNYEQTPNIKLVRFLKMIKVGHESMNHHYNH